jgi:predicted PP-loop superfamily ATPase
MEKGAPYSINKSLGYPPKSAGIVLCFSGGRDSSCAALKLIQKKKSPLLLTIIDSNLQTDQKTEGRVKELRDKFGLTFSWVSICAQPFYEEIFKTPVLTSPSCFNCFMVKLSVAIIIAKKHSVSTIATGFTSYQASWVEQSRTAIDETKKFLSEYELSLELPVWDIQSKEDASKILSNNSMSPEPLEPVCHCAEKGTMENADPQNIRSDFSKLSVPCRDFIDLCLRKKQ